MVRKTTNPVYDEDFTFYGVTANQAVTGTLHFVILSFDRYSRDDVIGEVLCPVAELIDGDSLHDQEVSFIKEIAPRHFKVCHPMFQVSYAVYEQLQRTFTARYYFGHKTHYALALDGAQSREREREREGGRAKGPEREVGSGKRVTRRKEGNAGMVGEGAGRGPIEDGGWAARNAPQQALNLFFTHDLRVEEEEWHQACYPPY